MVDCLRLSQLQWCHSAPVRFKRSAEEIYEEIFTKKFSTEFFSLSVFHQKFILVHRNVLILSEIQKYEKQLSDFFGIPIFRRSSRDEDLSTFLGSAIYF